MSSTHKASRHGAGTAKLGKKRTYPPLHVSYFCHCTAGSQAEDGGSLPGHVAAPSMYLLLSTLARDQGVTSN
jgi:hypothetical protein